MLLSSTSSWNSSLHWLEKQNKTFFTLIWCGLGVLWTHFIVRCNLFLWNGVNLLSTELRYLCYIPNLFVNIVKKFDYAWILIRYVFKNLLKVTILYLGGFLIIPIYFQRWNVGIWIVLFNPAWKMKKKCAVYVNHKVITHQHKI